MELNKFDKALRQLVLFHAPELIVKCGDIVTARCRWSKAYKVKIIKISFELVAIDCSVQQRNDMGLTGWMTVQPQFIGRRIKGNGEFVKGYGFGFLLDEFTTSKGKQYKRLFNGFNHAGLTFDIAEYKPIEVKEG